MSSTRKLTQIPSCMRMSFIYPWENSPEKEIGNPLSFDPPDISSDMEAIYGEGAAKYFLASTTTNANKGLPVFLGDSPYEDVFAELFGSEPTIESPSGIGSSPASSSGYSSDLSFLSCVSPSPSPERGVPGGKKEQWTTISNARARCLPYQRRPLDSPPTPTSLLSFSGSPGLTLGRASPPAPPTSSPVSSNPDDVMTPEFTRSLQFVSPGTPMAGPPSLPESRGPALSVNMPPTLRPQRRSKSPAKSRPSPSRPTQEIAAGAPKRPEAFAHQYCRFPNCDRRFADKRTTERHRLTHLDFGTYVCPNPACDSRTKARPNFASDFSLGRHLKVVADDSPCAVGKGQRLSLFKQNAAQAEALIQQSLVPFDPAIHTPF